MGDRRKTVSAPEQVGRALSDGDVRLIQASYDALWKARGEASVVFYDTLFRLAPDTRKLFKGDMDIQRRQLMAALGYIVTEIEKPDIILPALKAAAHKHVGYGVQPHHYDQVGVALVATVEALLGPRFAPAWELAYARISKIMRQEAYPSE